MKTRLLLFVIFALMVTTSTASVTTGTYRRSLPERYCRHQSCCIRNYPRAMTNYYPEEACWVLAKQECATVLMLYKLTTVPVDTGVVCTVVLTSVFIFIISAIH